MFYYIQNVYCIQDTIRIMLPEIEYFNKNTK